MIRAGQSPLRECLTSPALVVAQAKKHGAQVVPIPGYIATVVFRPSGEAILWRAVVPESERVALGLAVA